MRDIRFKFVYQNVDGKYKITDFYTIDDLFKNTEDNIWCTLSNCNCQPVGETNYVECNCDEEDAKYVLKHKLEFTGIKDKNNNPIYEGDILRWRQAYRSTQTHYGDNIPNGAYTEPMEAEIRTHEYEVIYKDGMFGCEVESPNDYHSSDNFMPLIWCGHHYDTIDDIKEAVAYRHSDDFWDLPKGDGSDLEYLLETYNCETNEQLLEYVNVFEVIGNIYQNPELI